MVTTVAEAFLVARQTDEPCLLLLTMTHPALETYRLVRDAADIVSRGETFKAAWFEETWVNDDGNIPRCSISVPNVDAEIGRKLLRQSVAPEITLEAIMATDPDTPIMRVARLELRSLRVDPVAITGELVGKDHSAEPLGSIMVLPANFPALFRRQRKT
jgi:hypothetical protein